MDLQKIELRIEKLNSAGEGLARHEGKVCFVPWGVPGDGVLVQVEKEGRDYNECRILEIIEKSPDRIEPPCPYFTKCGGCQLQQMTYEAQLKWKRQIVMDALSRISRISMSDILPLIPSPKVWNYRNRIRLHCDRKGRVGFYRHQSHEIIEIEKCLIADESLNEKLKAKSEKQKTEFELRVDESKAFSQVNPEQNETLIGLVAEMADLKGDESVIDLYCGHGNLTFPLAPKAKMVIGVDRDITAINEAIHRSAESGIKNIRWIQGSASQTLVGFKAEGISVDVLVTDPPRRGLAETAERILLLRPKRIIYVSCNPATFARDAAGLIRGAYRLVSLQPLDMFPHTAHVEVVGSFERT